MSYLSPDNMRVAVSDPVVDGGVVKYKVSIATTGQPDKILNSCFRRFNEFDTVFKRLLEMNPDPPLPTLPEKRLFGNNDPAFIEKRRREIEAVVCAVCANRFLVSDIEFLTLIGFSAAKAAFAQESSGSPSPRRSRNEVPMEECPDVPWLRPALSIRDEANLLAAQGFARSSGYTIEKLLPQLSFRSPRKTLILIKDSMEGTFVLSVVQPVAELSIVLDEDKRAGYLARLLQGLNAPCFAPPVDVAVLGSRVFVTRAVCKQGSVRDRLFGASWQDDAIKKYKSKTKPLKMDEVAVIGKQLLLMLKACHDFNVPCPSLHLGNCLVESGNQILFTDIEDGLLGVSRYPPVLPYKDGEPTSTTHIDLLLFGSALLEMILGSPITQSKEYQLLSVQGDPSGVSEEVIAGDPLESLPPIPDELATVLRYVFHRSNKADVDQLLRHSFFSKGKFKGPLKPMESADFSFPPMKLKRKDVELFAEATSKWQQDLEGSYERKRREEEGKSVLRDMKKKRSSRRAAAESPPDSPKQLASPQATSPKAAPPVPSTTQAAQPAPPPAPPAKVPPPAPPPPVKQAAAAPGPSALPAPTPPSGLPPPTPPPAKGIPPPPPPPPKGLPPPPPPPKKSS